MNIRKNKLEFTHANIVSLLDIATLPSCSLQTTPIHKTCSRYYLTLLCVLWGNITSYLSLFNVRMGEWVDSGGNNIILWYLGAPTAVVTEITHQKWHIEVVFSWMREMCCPWLTGRSSGRFQQPKMLQDAVTALDQCLTLAVMQDTSLWRRDRRWKANTKQRKVALKKFSMGK